MIDPKLALEDWLYDPPMQHRTPYPPGLPSSVPFGPAAAAPPAPPAPESSPAPLRPACPLVMVPPPPLPPARSPPPLPPTPPSSESTHELGAVVPGAPSTPGSPGSPGEPGAPPAPAPAMIASRDTTTLALLSSRMATELPPATVASALRIVRPSSVSAFVDVPVTAVVPPLITVALPATSRRNVVGL